MRCLRGAPILLITVFFSESPLVNAWGVNVFAQSPDFYEP